MLAWLSVWSKVQTCIWSSWLHCHSLSLAPVKSRLVLPFWYWFTRVVPDKGPLNGCVCVTVTDVLPFISQENTLKFFIHLVPRSMWRVLGNSIRQLANTGWTRQPQISDSACSLLLPHVVSLWLYIFFTLLVPGNSVQHKYTTSSIKPEMHNFKKRRQRKPSNSRL